MELSVECKKIISEIDKDYSEIVTRDLVIEVAKKLNINIDIDKVDKILVYYGVNPVDESIDDPSTHKNTTIKVGNFDVNDESGNKKTVVDDPTPNPTPGMDKSTKDSLSSSFQQSLLKFPMDDQHKMDRRIMNFEGFLKRLNYQTHDGQSDKTTQRGHGQNLSESVVTDVLKDASEELYSQEFKASELRKKFLANKDKMSPDEKKILMGEMVKQQKAVEIAQAKFDKALSTEPDSDDDDMNEAKKTAIIPTEKNAKITKQLEESVVKAAELSKQLKDILDEYKKKIDPIKNELTKLDKEVITSMQGMNALQLQIDKIVVKLDVTKGRVSESYKDLFEFAVSKMNNNLRNTISIYRDANKRLNSDKIETKYEIKEGVKEVIGVITEWLKTFWDDLKMSIRQSTESVKIVEDLLEISK